MMQRSVPKRNGLVFCQDSFLFYGNIADNIPYVQYLLTEEKKLKESS